MSDRNVFPPEAMNLLENLTTNSGDIETLLQQIENNTDELEAILQDVDLNTDELEAILQDVDDNTDTLESELQGVNSELDTIQTNTDNLETLLNSVISELQDVEADAESIDALLDELEDALASVATDQLRVDIIDEGDVATEATLSSANDFLDAIEDALASTGTDELRVNVVNQPISVDDDGGSLTVDTDDGPILIDEFLNFTEDPDNSTETPLAGSAEFVGDWVAWGDFVGISISIFADVVGGSNDDGSDALKIEISTDGGSTVDRTIEVDYPPNPTGGSPEEGIQPFISREGTHYRVRYQNGNDPQSIFRLSTFQLPKAVQTKGLPVADTVTDASIAELNKSVVTARDPDGNYINVGADRFDNLLTNIDNVGRDAYRYAPRGDVTLYGTQVIGSKVPQIDIQWHEEPSADDVLDTDGGNTGGYTQTNGAGVFNSGTGADDQYKAQTFQRIEYVSGFEIQYAITTAWTQPPTSAGDYSTLGLSDGDNGFELGYKGTQFGIRHLARGLEQDFVEQPDFNIDKLDGNPESEYRRNGEPVAINHQTQNVWRIRFGWYGTAPTHIEVLAPDGHWVAAHKFDFTLDAFPQTETPNLPGRINLDKNSSDATDLVLQSGAWYGGITANVGVAQQPDGDYVSEKASGEAFTEQELLTANETFTSDWIDTDGWESFELQVISDQPSAVNGVEIQFTEDVQSENPQPRVNTRFTYTQDQVDANEALIAILPTELDGLRVNYTNGGTGQNEFSLSLTLRTSRIGQSTTLTDPIDNTDLAQTVRALSVGEDDSGEFDFIGRIQDALKVSIENQSVDLDLDANDNWQSRQVEVSNLNSVRIDPSPLTDRKSIRIANEGPNDAEVYIGNSSAVTEDDGYPIDLEEEETLSISEAAEVWAILNSDVTGATQQQTLNANNTLVNNGVTNPDNAFASDDTYAVFTDQNDNVEYGIEDFTFSSGFAVIADVRMGFEASEGAAQFQTIALEEITTAIQTGGTSITTDASLTVDTDGYYMAFVSIRDDIRSVNSVSGLGLDWGVETTATNTNGVTVELWTATGEPTISEPVTANFDDTVSAASIAAQRWSGVDTEGAPVDATVTNTNSTAGWQVTPTGTQSGDRIVGGAAIAANTTNAPGGDDTEHSERSQGGAQADRLTMATQSREAASVDELTDGTWGTPGEWAAVGIALNQRGEPEPQLTLEYEVGSEGIGATSLTENLTNSVDQDFTVDITGDRIWTDSDIDNTTLFLTENTFEARNAEVDHVFMEIVEAEEGATQRIGILEEGD